MPLRGITTSDYICARLTFSEAHPGAAVDDLHGLPEVPVDVGQVLPGLGRAGEPIILARHFFFAVRHFFLIKKQRSLLVQPKSCLDLPLAG